MKNDRSMMDRLLSLVDRPDNSTDSVSQLQHLAEGMPGGFFIYQAAGKEELLCVNSAVLRIFNCQTEAEFRALTGNSFRGMVHPDDLEAVEASIQEQIAHSQYDLDYVEYRIVQKGGALRWIEDYGHFLRSRVWGDVFCVFIADATDKHLLMEEIQRQSRDQLSSYHQALEGLTQEQLRHLEVIHGLSVDYTAIFYADLEENTIQTYRVSPRIQCQFSEETKCQPFLGFADRYLEQWVVPEDRIALNRALDPTHIRTALSQGGVFRLNYRVRGEIQPEYLQLCMVHVGRQDSVRQVVLGVRSVDGEIRREMEQRETLEATLRRANEAVTAKDTFLSNMSHDMRTPMNAVIGFATLAKSHLDDRDKLEHYLDGIQSSSRQMLGLINDVLELVRLESGKSGLENRPCDLVDIARQVHLSLLPQATAKGLRFFSLDSGSLTRAPVCSDREKLTTLLSHLAGNALQYTPAGGDVSIALRQLQPAPQGYGKYQLTVSDSGIGISPEFLPHIFTPFEREQNTTQSGFAGTGLGLSIVKALVDLLGGEIQADSAPDKGSRFTVTLTLPCQTKDASGSLPPLPPLPHGGGKVLVAEDNELNREILLELLHDLGLTADGVCDGAAALSAIERSQPGEYVLILMDLQMPVMDGYQAARAIRALDRSALARIPIIAVSANAFEEDRRRSLECGMNAHLAKPVDLAALVREISRLLN